MSGVEVLTALLGLIPTIKEMSKVIKDLKKAPLDEDAKEAVREMAEGITKSFEEIVKVTTPFTGLLATDPDFPKEFMNLYREFNAGMANNEHTVRTYGDVVGMHLERLVGYEGQIDREPSMRNKIKNFGIKFRLNREAVERLEDIAAQFEGADKRLYEEVRDYLNKTYRILTSIKDDISASQSAQDKDRSMELGDSAKKKFDNYTSTIMPHLKDLTFLLSELKVALGSFMT